MTHRRVDLESWSRSDTYRHFRTFDRPHFATTVRLDVTTLMARKEDGLSLFRAMLWAFGNGVQASPALRLRFDDDGVISYDTHLLSGPVDLPDGNFRFCYIPFHAEFDSFDKTAAQIVEKARLDKGLDPTPPTGEAIFFSCLPWLDYTSIDNAISSRDDCVPRISWGKIVPNGDGFEVAASIQVHHALVDGRDVGTFFDATQNALSGF